jgi:hypothetical protein
MRLRCRAINKLTLHQVETQNRKDFAGVEKILSLLQRKRTQNPATGLGGLVEDENPAIVTASTTEPQTLTVFAPYIW